MILFLCSQQLLYGAQLRALQNLYSSVVGSKLPVYTVTLDMHHYNFVVANYLHIAWLQKQLQLLSGGVVNVVTSPF